MSWIDWTITIIIVGSVIVVGARSMKYVRGVTDFLACGRVCGRYVISVADLANGLALVVLIGSVEGGYSSGFAYGFWGEISKPLFMFLALAGFVTYRFRQTKAMSFGQFIEMRYSRGLRIFAATLRTLSDMLANMILPALAGRFFIYYLDLPETFSVFGLQVSTFMTVMLVCLVLAISMILMGGSVTLVITDTFQGLLAYPMLVLFVFFILYKFSWHGQILPTLMDRAPGESFLNPYEVENLRNFNIFYIVAGIFSRFMHRGVGVGGGGGSCAARSPHEQKMAGVLGTWRGGFMLLFYFILALAIVVFMNHKDFAGESTEIRRELSARIAGDIIADPAVRQMVIARTNAIPQHHHTAGVDAPLSVRKNLDTVYVDAVAAVAEEHPEANIKGKVLEFRTLFHQLMLPAFLRKVLPTGMIGLFCALVILMIISTDDSRIYSASLTFSQDTILPLLKKAPSPKQHINIIRAVTIGVGVFYFLGSSFMSQLEYVTLFIMVMYGIWSAGAGVMVLGGLYTRFGTAKGAWASLLTGSGLMVAGVVLQRNWGNFFYPLLVHYNSVEAVTSFFAAVSAPLNPYVVWEVTPYKFPVNAVELNILCIFFSTAVYFLVSLVTCRRPFNLDRMLHRGKYNTDGLVEAKFTWSWKNFFSKTVGITNEYTRGDRIIAWSVFGYSFVVVFGSFLLIVIWNMFHRWPDAWWGNYLLIMKIVIPCIIGIVTTVWFFVGGVIDLKRLFRDLKKRLVDNDDNGMVEGHVSLSDKKAFAKIEAPETEKK